MQTAIMKAQRRVRRVGWWLVVSSMGIACRTTAQTPAQPVVAAAPSPAPTQAPTKLRVVDDDAVLEVMQYARDTLLGEAETWIRTPFDSQAIAMAALLRLLPSSPHDAERRQAAADALGLDAAQVSAFMAEHPDLVERLEATVDEAGALARGLQTSSAHAQRERVAMLPRGDLEAVLGPISPLQRAALIELVPSMATPAGHLPGWSRGGETEGFRALVATAAEQSRAVVVFVRAEWAVPSKQMEEQVLDDPEVRERLGARQRIVIDLSSESGQDLALMDRLGTTVVPTLMLFPSASELAAALDDPAGKPPRSAVSLPGFTSKERLLERLD